MDISVNKHGNVVCGVFALCENEADGVITHPVLEYVPACARCACKVESDLIEAEFNVEIA